MIPPGLVAKYQLLPSETKAAASEAFAPGKSLTGHDTPRCLLRAPVTFLPRTPGYFTVQNMHSLFSVLSRRIYMCQGARYRKSPIRASTHQTRQSPNYLEIQERGTKPSAIAGATIFKPTPKSKHHHPGNARADLVVLIIIIAILIVLLVYWKLPELVLSSQQIQAQSSELDTEHRILLSLEVDKTRLLKSLIDGRVHLLEAANQYRALTLQQPHLPPILSSEVFPGRPEDELWLRFVIRDTQSLLLSENLPGGQAVLSRLQAEFEVICILRQVILIHYVLALNSHV